MGGGGGGGGEGCRKRASPLPQKEGVSPPTQSVEIFYKKLVCKALETLFLSLDPSQNGTSTSTSRQSMHTVPQLYTVPQAQYWYIATQAWMRYSMKNGTESDMN